MIIKPRCRSVTNLEAMIRLSSHICREVRQMQPRIEARIRRSGAAVQRSREVIAEIERKHSI